MTIKPHSSVKARNQATARQTAATTTNTSGRATPRTQNPKNMLVKQTNLGEFVKMQKTDVVVEGEDE